MLSFFRGMLRETAKGAGERLGFPFALGEMPYHLAMVVIGQKFEEKYKRRLNHQESFDICDAFTAVDVDVNDLCFLCGEKGADSEHPIHDKCIEELAEKIRNIIVHPISSASYSLGFLMGLPTGLIPKFALDGFLNLQIKMQAMVMAHFGEDKDEIAKFTSFLRDFQDQFASDFYQALRDSDTGFLRGMFKGARLHRFIKEPKKEAPKSGLVVETETWQVEGERQQA